MAKDVKHEFTLTDHIRLRVREVTTSNKWMCPSCGARGVNSPNHVPLCHICNYEITMVQISNFLYDHLGYQQWKANEYNRLHLHE